MIMSPNVFTRVATISRTPTPRAGSRLYYRGPHQYKAQHEEHAHDYECLSDAGRGGPSKSTGCGSSRLM